MAKFTFSTTNAVQNAAILMTKVSFNNLQAILNDKISLKAIQNDVCYDKIPFKMQF